MSTQTLEAIQAKRLAFLKASQLAPLPVDEVAAPTEMTEKDDEDDEKGGLPPPATEEDVIRITEFYKDSEKYLIPARDKISKGETPDAIDWKLALYQLFSAWIVNFGTDPAREEACEAIKAGDMERATVLLEQSQELIYRSAANLDLEWIPFIDLALTAFNPSVPEKYQQSGPFGGVFVSKGEFPFMILAFKGTTYPKEVNTDLNALTVEPREGVLYDERVHRGMYRGMFERFPGYENIGDAFDIIFENLESVAQDIQSSKQTPVPLYVTGHSLGAGYADLAYIELTRRLAIATTPPSYNLLDLYNYGAPRVCLNSLAAKVKQVLADTNRHLWRITRYQDIVPTIPSVVSVGLLLTTYKHFDGGYKLDPNGEAPYVSPRPSEIGFLVPIHNDPKPNTWVNHWPNVYYDALRKILDSAA